MKNHVDQSQIHSVEASVREKSTLLDFLNHEGIVVKQPGLRLNNFAVFLLFVVMLMVFIGAIIASISLESPWPIIAVTGALGLRSILAALLKR